MPEKKVFSEEYKKLLKDYESLRFATNELVAEYRAKELSCEHLIEIGAGIGFQTIKFAKTCKKITAIEKDKKRAFFLKKNIEIMKINNVEIIEGDALDDDIIRKISKADILFCDPERLPEEKERSLDRLKPNPFDIYEKYNTEHDKVGLFCYEIPPRIKNIPEEWGKEYISYKHRLNRLNVFFGRWNNTVKNKKKMLKRAVSLPGEYLLFDSGSAFETATIPSSYVHEIDESVVLSGIIGSLPGKGKVIAADNRKLLTSPTPIRSPFLTAYRVLTSTSEKSLESTLPRMRANKVYLKFSMDPEKIGKKKREFEKLMRASPRDIHLFKINGRILITEEATISRDRKIHANKIKHEQKRNASTKRDFKKKTNKSKKSRTLRQ